MFLDHAGKRAVGVRAVLLAAADGPAGAGPAAAVGDRQCINARNAEVGGAPNQGGYTIAWQCSDRSSNV